MEQSLEPPLRAAVHVLETHGYRYAIIGGIALSLWGVIRTTADIDIKVLVPDIDYEKARSVLRAEFAKTARSQVKQNPLIVSVEIEGVIVDFLLALPGYEEQIITRAIRRDMGDWEAWVCSAEDLVIQKAVAGRPKDWGDIELLLIEQFGKLDETYIDNWLSQFAELLEQPEILIQYQQLTQKIKRL